MRTSSWRFPPLGVAACQCWLTFDASTTSIAVNLAHKEGRQLQALVEEALTDLIEKHRLGRPRANVMAAYQESHERYAALYQELAK